MGSACTGGFRRRDTRLLRCAGHLDKWLPDTASKMRPRSRFHLSAQPGLCLAGTVGVGGRAVIPNLDTDTAELSQSPALAAARAGESEVPALNRATASAGSEAIGAAFLPWKVPASSVLLSAELGIKET